MNTKKTERQQRRYGIPRRLCGFRIDHAVYKRLEAVAIDRRQTVSAVVASILAKEVGSNATIKTT